MRILVTNDDGISAPGLKIMEAIATELAGAGGAVWTVAPAFEQSGVAHAVSYTKPMGFQKLSETRYACEGSPADCVLAGLHDVLKDDAPDLVLSGVNRGNNSAENALYSGTLGAAIEGALQGIPSIAMSQYYGPGNRDLENTFEASAQHGVDVVRRILSALNGETDQSYQLFFNVNFPPVAAADVKGIKLAPQGKRPNTGFRTTPLSAPSGRQFLWVTGGDQHVPTDAGTDAAVNLEGYISVTPMRADLTDHAALSSLAGIAT
ncbi:MAG: 5'/3'-nucleotidase SurE [Paracoccaceae bacterium]